MANFNYNDTEFSVTASGNAWDVSRVLPGGGQAVVGAGLFPGLLAAEAEAKAHALVKTIYPVGVKSVGPDVTHPLLIGDLKIVPPDVVHPNFIYWDKESSSCPRQL